MPKPPAWIDPRRRLREAARRPGRACAGQCGETLPVGRLSHYCFACDREARLHRAAYARPCSGGCGATIPAGQQYNLCRDCGQRYRTAYRERKKHELKLCFQCRDLVPRGRAEAICSDCMSIRGVEYRARKRAKEVQQWPKSDGPSAS